jgi:hypothetical protein
MKFYITLLCLLIVVSSFSQNDFSEKDAKQLIAIFFEGFHKGDTLLMKSVMADEMIMQTAYSDNEGNHKVKNDSGEGLLTAIANRPETQKWDERLEGYEIQIDGNLAHVWTPYQFWFNDTFSHCGANAFTLVKTNDGWKIIHLIDSRRKTSCKLD